MSFVARKFLVNSFPRTISPDSNERMRKLRLFRSKYQALIEQICVSVSEEVISQHELAIKYLTQHNEKIHVSGKKPAKFHFSISSFWVPAMNFYMNTFFLSDVSTFSCDGCDVADFRFFSLLSFK